MMYIRRNYIDSLLIFLYSPYSHSRSICVGRHCDQFAFILRSTPMHVWGQKHKLASIFVTISLQGKEGVRQMSWGR